MAKRLICLLLILVIYIPSMVACYQPDSKSGMATELPASQYSGVLATTEVQTVITQEPVFSMAPSPTPKPTPTPTPTPTLEPFTVYQDNRVIIKFKKITNRGVVFEVENLTDINITIQADSVSVNGASTDSIIMSDDVAPQSIGDVVAELSMTEIINAKVINRVSGQLRIIDFDYSFDSYDAPFEVILNDEPGYYEAEYSKALLYTDNRVDIYYWDLGKRGVEFLVRNKTDLNITIQADSVSINRRSTDDIIMSDDVAPHSVGIVTAKCSIEVTGEVETVGGQLRIIDFNYSFNSYNASFVNVDVTQYD